jgi:hypothetical protein
MKMFAIHLDFVILDMHFQKRMLVVHGVCGSMRAPPSTSSPPPSQLSPLPVSSPPPPRSSLPPRPSISLVSSLPVLGDSIRSSPFRPSTAPSPHDDATQRWRAGRKEEEFHGSGKVNRNLRLARSAVSGRSRWPSLLRETGVPDRPRRFKWQQGRKALVIQ